MSDTFCATFDAGLEIADWDSPRNPAFSRATLEPKHLQTERRSLSELHDLHITSAKCDEPSMYSASSAPIQPLLDWDQPDSIDPRWLTKQNEFLALSPSSEATKSQLRSDEYASHTQYLSSTCRRRLLGENPLVDVRSVSSESPLPYPTPTLSDGATSCHTNSEATLSPIDVAFELPMVRSRYDEDDRAGEGETERSCDTPLSWSCRSLDTVGDSASLDLPESTSRGDSDSTNALSGLGEGSIDDSPPHTASTQERQMMVRSTTVVPDPMQPEDGDATLETIPPASNSQTLSNDRSTPSFEDEPRRNLTAATTTPKSLNADRVAIPIPSAPVLYQLNAFSNYSTNAPQQHNNSINIALFYLQLSSVDSACPITYSLLL